MSFKRLTLAAALLASASGFIFAGDAKADPTTLKVGTLAPAESPWGKVFKAVARGRSRSAADGAIELQFFWNGSRATRAPWSARCARASSTARRSPRPASPRSTRACSSSSCRASSATGAKLDNARNTMRPGSTPRSTKQGFKVLGWGDVGIAHLMTKGFEVKTPADLKHKNCFFLAGDPIEPMFYSVDRRREPKQVTVPEILPALTAGTINVVNAPRARGRAAPVGVAPRPHQQLRRGRRHRRARLHVGEDQEPPRRRAERRHLDERQGRRRGAHDEHPQRGRRGLRAPQGAHGDRTTRRRPRQAQWAKVFAETRARLRGTTFDPQVFDEAVRYAQ